MCKSAPVRRGKISSWLGRLAGSAWILALALSTFPARAQDLRLEAIDVQPLPGQQIELRLQLSGPAPEDRKSTRLNSSH